MALYWRELLGRLTGVSTPVFGVSWEPSVSKRDLAHDFIMFLEDRRFLFTPFEDEDAGHIVESIMQTREKLTELIERCEDNDVMSSCLVSARAATRNFLAKSNKANAGGIYLGFHYVLALGELRSAVGFQIAIVSKAFGIDVPDSLVDILPAKETKTDRER